MKKILVLSDTHGYLDDAIMHHVSEADEVWHGGDWGNAELSDRISAIKPLKGVYGNIDGEEVRKIHPLVNRFSTEGVNVLITHIAGYPGRYSAFAKDLLRSNVPDILVCGHSHILKVQRAAEYGKMLHINPGAAGISGFHQVRTMFRMKLDKGRIFDAAVIELGKRAVLKDN